MLRAMNDFVARADFGAKSPPHCLVTVTEASSKDPDASAKIKILERHALRKLRAGESQSVHFECKSSCRHSVSRILDLRGRRLSWIMFVVRVCRACQDMAHESQSRV